MVRTSLFGTRRRYRKSELRTTTYARPLVRDERRAGREASSSDRSHAHRTAKGPKTDRTITGPRDRDRVEAAPPDRRATTRSELSLRSPAPTPRPQVHALPDHVVTQTVLQSRQGPYPLAMHSHLALPCSARLAPSLAPPRLTLTRARKNLGGESQSQRDVHHDLNDLRAAATHQAAADFLSAASKLMAPACRRSWVPRIAGRV